jgi:hypothetical protein
MCYAIRNPNPNPTTTTTTPSPPQQRRRTILGFQIDIINLLLRTWMYLAVTAYCLFARPFTSTGYWLVVASSMTPRVTVAYMPAERGEGPYSNLRAAIGVWCVWPRWEVRNIWLMLGGHLVAT